MLRTHRAGKGPGGCGGWGLGSRNRRGPVVPPTPGLRGQGHLTWEPSRLPGLKWVGLTPSSPLLLLPEGPSRLPLLISLTSVLCPQDPRGLEGALGRGYQPGNSAGSPAQVGLAITLCSSATPPRRSLPPASPDLPSLRGANPVWPPLPLPFQSPHVLLVHLGVPPVSLGVRVPHQWPAGALALGRH